MAKQYGLIVPGKKGAKKPEAAFAATKNVFGDDSDSDSEDAPPKKISFAPGDKLKRQAKAAQEKVLQEDPTVYQYDELYDTMEKSKKEKVLKTKVEKKPRYIEKLLDQANKRKKENERRIERQVQKEREEEGDKFADKESFVTTSYKNKLEEMRLEEEKEKRMEYLEGICDVTKQNDLGGFYRHLYNQQLNSKDDEPKETKPNPDDEETKSKSEDENKSKSEDENKSKSEDENKSKPKDGNDAESEKKDKIKRSYRKRKHTDDKAANSDSDDDTMNIKDIKTIKSQSSHLSSNLDADSDFSIDDSSSDDETGDKPKKKDNTAEAPAKQEDEKTSENAELKKSDDDNFKKPEAPSAVKEEVVEKVEEVKPKIDIWKKRTVGVLFQEALQRYYERKARR